jgi:hypothetical protein
MILAARVGPDMINPILRVRKLSKRLRHWHEICCSVEMSQAGTDRVTRCIDRAEDEIKTIAASLQMRPDFCHDPRGCAVTLCRYGQEFPIF